MEDKITVGEIEGYPVTYNPNKNHVFCKNTTVDFDLMKKVINSDTAHHRIEASKLSIFKLGSTVTLGCLTTSLENIENIIKTIDKLK